MRMTRSGLPIASSIGFTSANARASPPTMIDSDAVDRADFAAADRARRASWRRAMPRAPRAAGPSPGAMLLLSMRIVPGCSALKTPSGPSSTSSTSGESGTIVMMRVARRATSAGDVRASGTRRDDIVDRPLAAAVHDDGKPALSRFFAMGRPMRPSPMNPMVSVMGREYMCVGCVAGSW